MIAHEHALKFMLAQPKHQQAIHARARSSGIDDHVERVRDAVGHVASHDPILSRLVGNIPAFADVAAQHASAAKQVQDAEAKKVSKSSVAYRPGSVAEHCGNCSMYRDHACTLVRGVIDPSFTCKKWEAQKDRGVEKQTSRLAHTQEIAGANPASATNSEVGYHPISAAQKIKAHRSILQGARRAPDGHLYVEHQPGKFARVQEHGVNGSMAASKSAGVGSNPTALAKSNNGNVSYGGDDERGVNDSMATPQDRQDDQVRTIDFIRHGETDMNESADKGRSVDLIRGHQDVPLNENGKKQAAKTGEALKADPPHVLYSSDLCRSKLTAQIIHDKTGVPIAGHSDHFRPWDAGQLTGQPSKKAVPIMAHYAEQTPDKPLPGGESFHTFLGRYFIGLHHVLTSNPGKRVGIVAHHRNERALHSWAAKGYPADGSIDHRTFAEKGEDPGHVQRIQIPMDRLAQVAQRWRNASMAQTPNQPQGERPGQE